MLRGEVSHETPNAPLSRDELAAIARRASEATFGPWQWFGTPKNPYLATVAGGRVYVLMPRRSGMQGATIYFQSLRNRGIEPASEFAVKEVDYRDDITHIAHPDAEFMAHARVDVVRLLATVDARATEIARLEALVIDGEGHRCEWCRRVDTDGEYLTAIPGDDLAFYCAACVKQGDCLRKDEDS